MSQHASTIRVGGPRASAARRDRDIWCARGAVARMQAGLAQLGVAARFLADTPLLRVRDDGGGLWDLACVPDRNDDDTLWWAWLHPGPRAGAAPELEFICPADDHNAAEQIVGLLRTR